jgi:hypothetical protein
MAEGPMSLKTEFEGWQLVRRCDAYALLGEALEAFGPIAERQELYGEQDIANAREELRDLRGSAYAAWREFRRAHGFPER